MGQILSSLAPTSLWAHFEKICSMPHTSKHEEQLAKHIMKYVSDLGLDAIRDDIGNIIVRKPATKGMEGCKTVALQAHLDMVPQKNSDTRHDFERDPITPYIDGDWVKARGTTLGADNGIGIAAALMVLESTQIKHGPLEVLLTVDEEAGMTGAFGLKAGVLGADFLFNLDSEDEGELCVGCAGGVNTNAHIDFSTYQTPASMKGVKVEIVGLKGGHSGCDITLGRANAIKLMGRLLTDLHQKVDFGLAEICGGSLRNAIPREAFAVLAVDSLVLHGVMDHIREFETIVKHELFDVETDLAIRVAEVTKPVRLIDKEASNKFIAALCASVNGVIRMKTQLANTVETSTNLGIVEQRETRWVISTLQRSSVETCKMDAANMVACALRLAGARVEHTGGYPGWKPNLGGTVLSLLRKNYKDLFGVEPKTTVTHGGLECGLIGSLYPKMEMISFGPTIRFPHSPDEKVNIPSVSRFVELLVYTLERIPQKP